MNKKLILSMLLFLSTANMATAVPAMKGIWRTARLADGTQVRVQLAGDEHGSWWTDGRGNAYVMKAAEGNEILEPADLKTLARAARERREAANTLRRHPPALRGREARTGDPGAVSGREV